MLAYLLQKEIVDYIEAHRGDVFDNKLRVNRAFDDVVTEQSIMEGALQAPAILTIFQSLDMEPVNDATCMSRSEYIFALLCISTNIATPSAKTDEAYWLAQKCIRLFRGKNINIVYVQSNGVTVTRNYDVSPVAVLPEIREKELNAYVVTIVCQGLDGDDDDTP